MRYQVWRNRKYGSSYRTSVEGDTLPEDEELDLIRTFEAETWDDAKRLANAFISEYRGREFGAKWLAAPDPGPMLAMVKGRKYDRKLRLFAVACCRRLVTLCDNEVVQKALLVAEQFADGLALKPQRRNAFDSVLFGFQRQTAIADALGKVAFEAAVRSSEGVANRVAQSTVRHFPQSSVESISECEAVRRSERTKEREHQVLLLRDVFGNPFRPVSVDPTWLTSTVLTLAEGIYQDRAFDRMPILADALQDAGCDNDDILTHCRGPGLHVRGCWVVDLLTGRK